MVVFFHIQFQIVEAESEGFRADAGLLLSTAIDTQQVARDRTSGDNPVIE